VGGQLKVKLCSHLPSVSQAIICTITNPHQSSIIYHKQYMQSFINHRWLWTQ